MSETKETTHPNRFLEELQTHYSNNLGVKSADYIKKFAQLHRAVLRTVSADEWRNLSEKEFCLRVMPSVRYAYDYWVSLQTSLETNEKILHPNVVAKTREYLNAADAVLRMAYDTGVITRITPLQHKYMTDEIRSSWHAHPSQTSGDEEPVAPVSSEDALAAAHCEHVIRSFTEPMRTKYMQGQREHGGNLAEKPVFPMMKEEILDMWCYYKVAEDQQETVKKLLSEALVYFSNPRVKQAIGSDDSGCAFDVVGALYLKIKQALNILEYGNKDGKPLQD